MKRLIFICLSSAVGFCFTIYYLPCETADIQLQNFFAFILIGFLLLIVASLFGMISLLCDKLLLHYLEKKNKGT